MTIRALAVGKRHEKWITDGIERYETRLRKPFDLSWQLLPHSSRDGEAARTEESHRLLERISRDDYVVLLDERGSNIDSPALADKLRSVLDRSKPVVFVIGGAFGVDNRVRARADFVWSLSKLVFPHQLVRLILTEQLYRAQEISAGRSYHHV